MIHQFDGYCIGGYFYMVQILVVLKHQSCQKLNHQRHQYNMLNDKIMMEMIWCKTQNKFSISSCKILPIYLLVSIVLFIDVFLPPL